MTSRPLPYYYTGVATWFFAAGLQAVMFAWLVAMVLFEAPSKVGIAQTMFLLPGLMFLLVGGSVAERYGAARVAFVTHLLGILPPLFLAAAIYYDALSFSAMLVYAVAMGFIQAIVTPARDGLLNDVAAGRVQRTVMMSSLVQVGMQLVGVAVAGFADRTGGAFLLCVQSAVIAIGALAFRPLRGSKQASNPSLSMSKAIRDGAATVFASPAMRAVCLQNLAMGTFFMGSFIVTLPLLVREVFAGSASELSYLNGANAAGMSMTIIVLLRFGVVARPGRALLLALGMGSLVLAFAGIAPSLPLLIFVSFIWGVCGGVAITMARTIMQEQAPADQRSRVMSIHSLTFMGAGPLGTMLAGYMVEDMGPQLSVMGAAGGMGVVVVLMLLFTSLWRVTTQAAHAS